MPLTLILAAAAALTLPAPLRGDFDGDGRADRAEVVARAGGHALIVTRAAAPDRPVTIDSVTDPANAFLRLATNETRATACAKGAGASSAPCARRSMTIRGDVLAFGSLEASEAVALWNGRGFDVVSLSD